MVQKRSENIGAALGEEAGQTAHGHTVWKSSLNCLRHTVRKLVAHLELSPGESKFTERLHWEQRNWRCHFPPLLLNISTGPFGGTSTVLMLVI